MKALVALHVLLCTSVVIVQSSPGLFGIDHLLEGVGEILNHESLSSAVNSDAMSLSSASISKDSDDMKAGAANISNAVGHVAISASDSTDDTHRTVSESASPSPTENAIRNSLASMDKMAESSHSQRKSKSTSSGTTPDDATAIDAAADANGNDSNVDNELDLEDEDAFVDTKTVVETQLVLLAPDLPNRDVIVSAPMSFEAMISSSESLSTKSHMWAIISISIMPLLL